MAMIQHIYKSDPILTATIVASLTLAAAFGFQMAGYAPCDLCWVQRYPYMLIIAVGLLATLTKQKAQFWPLISITLLSLWDAGVAIYHTGVEQKWWQGPSTCTGGSLDPDTINISIDTLYKMNEAVVRCDEIPWDLFGISMAGFNALIATGLTLYCIKALLHLAKKV